MEDNDRPFGGIDHIGIAVRDLAQATETYEKMLGFSITGGESLPERGLEVRFVDAGNSRIELIGETKPGSEIGAFLQSRGEGIHHICVQVYDIDATLATLAARGVRVVGGGQARTGANGTRVAFVHPKAAHGVLLELVEKPGTEESEQ